MLQHTCMMIKFTGRPSRTGVAISGLVGHPLPELSRIPTNPYLLCAPLYSVRSYKVGSIGCTEDQEIFPRAVMLFVTYPVLTLS